MIRKFIPGALVLGLIVSAHAQPKTADEVQEAPVAEEAAAPAADPAQLKVEASYALGFQNGRQLASYGLIAEDCDQEAFLKGFMGALKGGEAELSEEKIEAALNALGETLQAREKEKASANLEAGKAFLAKNGAREGVTTTDSGLQFEILTRGEGEKYKESETPKQFMVNYRGTTIDGTQFDASPEGEPVPMTLQVIEGFKEALTTMPVGSKWKLFIPSELAYGEQRRGADIAPNSVLIFELELVKIEDAPAAPEGGLPFPMPQGE